MVCQRCASVLLIAFLLLQAFSTGNYISVQVSMCDTAPTEDLRIICSQLQNWDQQARQHISIATHWRASVSASYSKTYSQQQYNPSGHENSSTSQNSPHFAYNSQEWTGWSSWTSGQSENSGLGTNIKIRARSRSVSSGCSNGVESTMCQEQEPIHYTLKIDPGAVNQKGNPYYVVQTSGTLPQQSDFSGLQNASSDGLGYRNLQGSAFTLPEQHQNGGGTWSSSSASSFHFSAQSHSTTSYSPSHNVNSGNQFFSVASPQQQPSPSAYRGRQNQNNVLTQSQSPTLRYVPASQYSHPSYQGSQTSQHFHSSQQYTQPPQHPKPAQQYTLPPQYPKPAQQYTPPPQYPKPVQQYTPPPQYQKPVQHYTQLPQYPKPAQQYTQPPQYTKPTQQYWPQAQYPHQQQQSLQSQQNGRPVQQHNQPSQYSHSVQQPTSQYSRSHQQNNQPPQSQRPVQQYIQPSQQTKHVPQQYHPSQHSSHQLSQYPKQIQQHSQPLQYPRIPYQTKQVPQSPHLNHQNPQSMQYFRSVQQHTESPQYRQPTQQNTQSSHYQQPAQQYTQSPQYPRTTLQNSQSSHYPQSSQQYPQSGQHYPQSSQQYPQSSQHHSQSNQQYPQSNQHYPLPSQQYPQSNPNHPQPSQQYRQSHQNHLSPPLARPQHENDHLAFPTSAYPTPSQQKSAGQASTNNFGLSVKPEVSSPYECKTLTCLCIFIHGTITNSECRTPIGGVLQPAVRKEYRQMDSTERAKFHDAVKQMQSSGEYAKIAQWHANPELCGGAHSGPAFLPWHREYVKRFEIALRVIDHTVSLPYWDSTIEGQLQDGKDSCLFNEELMGGFNRASDINSTSATNKQQNYRRYRRQIGQHGRPLREKDIEAFLRTNNIEDVLAYTAPKPGCFYTPGWTNLEYSNGNVLLWLGGQSFQPSTSAYDPLFYMHHAFLDKTPSLRSQMYPPDSLNCSSEDHFANSIMSPFVPLKNIDGISNYYTENLYRYSSRPTCRSGRDDECGSRYLFCDRSHGVPHCAAKVRYGGNCIGFENNENPCISGFCNDGICS